MRFLITASAAALLFVAGATANAETPSIPEAAVVTSVTQDPQVVAQPPDINVQIDDNPDTVWYASPVWIAIGALAIIILGLVIGMAARGGSGGGGSTIVK